MIALSIQQARALALRAQGFGDRSLRKPVDVLDRLGVIQLDSVNVVARTHDLVPFSRIGAHDLSAMYEAIYRKKRGFEYWGHEASWLPMDTLPYFRSRMARFREDPRNWRGTFRADHEPLYQAIMDRIHLEGPLGSAAFEDTRPQRGTWWDWKPAKRALEDLFACGELTSGGRTVGFARLYELPERYFPPGLDDDPGPDATARYLTKRAIAALGVATGMDAADYYRQRTPHWRAQLKQLISDGEVVELKVAGWKPPAYALPAALAGSTRTPKHRPTFLTPFDNLIWSRDRTERLFGFHYRISIYTPAAQRVHGYYVLPLLASGQLGGRADLKLERKEKLLRCRALFFEGASPEDAASALRDLARHLQAERVVVEKVEPAGNEGIHSLL